jgi:hypothetical protein
LEFTYVTAKGDLGLSHWNVRWNHEKNIKKMRNRHFFGVC